MIVVDTHIWVWWAASSDRLSSSQVDVLRRGEQVKLTRFSGRLIACLR